MRLRPTAHQMRRVWVQPRRGTGNDRDNRAAVRSVPTADLDLVGLAVHGQRNAVDKVAKAAHMHP